MNKLSPTSIKMIIAIVIVLSLTVAYLFRSPIKRVIKKIIPPVVLKEAPSPGDLNIVFLHHSTGNAIWKGGVAEWFDNYRKDQNSNYYIIEQEFPKTAGNYPYDYWNIWVKNQGSEPFENDPTLEIITKEYEVVIFKHCYPVTDIVEDTDSPDVSSDQRSIQNYKLQYEALKRKMHEFPESKFILWTGASRVKAATNEDFAQRGRIFFDWVKNEWNEPGDNIFLWDFYKLETEGGIYFKDEYALAANDSHPNQKFAHRASQLFCQRIIDVIEGRGDVSNITGGE